jgi:predicted nucleotidyltransferase
MDITTRFENALQSFVNKIKNDPNVRAVILCGSMANDTVWEKSDMDITVLVREMKLLQRNFTIDEDGLILNVNLQSEFDFKRSAGRSMGGGIIYSFYYHARIVHTKDESLREFLSDFKKMGADDRARTFFVSAAYLLGDLEKLEKWLTVKNDLMYTQLWVLKVAESYANMRLVLDDKPLSREAVLKVTAYDPEAMKPIYEKPMQSLMTRGVLNAALQFYKDFLKENVELLTQPVLSYMADNEPRTMSAINKHFNMQTDGLHSVFGFLEEMGVVARVTEYTRITPKSKDEVEEVAYVYTN